MPQKSYQTLGWESRRLTITLTIGDWQRLEGKAGEVGQLVSELIGSLCVAYAHSLRQWEQANSSEAIAALARGFNEAH